MKEKITVKLADPCGFCSGVRRALELIDRTLEGSAAPIYILKGLIHNSGVTEDLKRRGCVFADTPEEIPVGGETVFGAHGVAPDIEKRSADRSLHITDATCPLVKQLQHAAASVPPGRPLVLFGHRGHPELEGVIGHAGSVDIHVVENAADAELLPELKDPVLLIQTTLSHIDADKVKLVLQKKYPGLETPGGICRASLLRQQAVEALAPECDLFVVVGSSHSSNANRLRESAARCGVPAVLLDTPEEITPEMVSGVKIVGVSAAASTPEDQIKAVMDRLTSMEC